VDVPNLAPTAISGKNDDGRELRLERTIQEAETLDIEHVDLSKAAFEPMKEMTKRDDRTNLVDEEDSGNELSHSLVDVLRNDLRGGGRELNLGTNRYHSPPHSPVIVSPPC